MSERPLPVLAYTVPELAVSANVSQALVWQEIKHGELDSCLIGDRRLITPEQAERWLKRKAERARQRREAQQQLAAERAPTARPATRRRRRDPEEVGRRSP